MNVWYRVEHIVDLTAAVVAAFGNVEVVLE